MIESQIVARVLPSKCREAVKVLLQEVYGYEDFRNLEVYDDLFKGKEKLQLSQGQLIEEVIMEAENEKTLNGTPESLMGMGGSAMLIPQQLTAWDAAGDKPNAGKGAYLAVKLQITTKAGARVYPAEIVGDYDWAAVPINTNWEAGKKYVYTLDFTSGAGKVDPEKDPSDPTDPFKPGDDILGNNAIKFTVQVTEWVEETKDVDM